MHQRKPDISECSCLYSRDNLFDFPELKEILPSDYEYTVCNWNKVDAGHFESRFRVNIATKAQVYVWLKHFSAATNTTFKEERGLPECEEAIILSFRCKHIISEPPRKYEDIAFLVSKQYVCPTRLVIILKLPTFAGMHGLRDDVHFYDFPMTVIYQQHHNHPHEIPDSTKKDLSDIMKYLEALPSSRAWLADEMHSIINSLNELEIEFQESVEKSYAAESQNHTEFVEFQESVEKSYAAESRNHTEFVSYQEMLDSLFPAECAEEENVSDFLLPPEKYPFYFNVDIDSLMDYFILNCKGINRATCKTNRSGFIWIWPDQRGTELVERKMLPDNPMQDIINQALEKLWNLEVEENSKTV